MACPSTCEQCKGHLPLASVGRWPSALLARGERPKWWRDPFAQLEFFDLSRSLRDRSVPPLPILTCLCGAYGAFAGFAMPRAGHRASRTAGGAASGARWTCASGASGRMSRRLVAPSSPFFATDLQRPCWVAGIPLRSLIAQLLLDRRCPWPGAEALFASARVGVAVSREDATWLILPVVICLSQRLSHACVIKKLVVGPWVGSIGPPRGVHRSTRPFYRRCAPGLNWPGRASGAVTLKKLECSKQAYALDTLAWDNITGFRSYCVGPGSE
ncbi:hypothetical protein H6P81_021711 [Aristolochia fimbriata]|uniref:Uncharacterized protein n=1 Tax=Aristolochia fimbriata TaxID=158543 RepID=A0AAV7DQW0_ARIFI|nr:hypothetical protein H6P81_021711 [Aristolochia fimbriata]